MNKPKGDNNNVVEYQKHYYTLKLWVACKRIDQSVFDFFFDFIYYISHAPKSSFLIFDLFCFFGASIKRETLLDLLKNLKRLFGALFDLSNNYEVYCLVNNK